MDGFDSFLEDALRAKLAEAGRPLGRDGAFEDVMRRAELDRPPRPAIPSCYLTLGLARVETDPEALRRAFRRRARHAHPDGGGTHQGFLQLQRAYAEALSRSRRRAA